MKKFGKKHTKNVRKCQRTAGKTMRSIEALVLAAGLAVSLTACGGDAGDGAGEGGMEGISLGDGPAAAGGSGASGDIAAEAGNSADSGTAFGGTAGSSGLKFLCTVNEEGCHTQSGYYYIEKEQKKLTDGSYGSHLMYMDFETLQEVFLCSNAGCGHDSPDCPSVLPHDDFEPYGTLIFPYQGSLYLFSKRQDDDGSAQTEFIGGDEAGNVETEGTASVLYRAGLDGTNREKVYTFDTSVTVEDYVCGDESGLYLVTKRLTSERDGVNTYIHSAERKLVFLDPAKGELSEVCSMDFDGYVSWRVVGCYDRNLVLQGTDYGRALSDAEMFSDDDYPELYKNSSEVFACLNMDSGQLTEKYRIDNREQRSFLFAENKLYYSMSDENSIKEVNLDTGDERSVYSEPGRFYYLCGIMGEKLYCMNLDGSDKTYYYIDRNTGELCHSGLVNKSLGWSLEFMAILDRDVLVVYDYEATPSGGGAYEITLYQYGLISQEDLMAGNDNFRKINMIGRGW